MEQSKDFDQRLGTILNLAFQHSKNLDSTFKVSDTFLKKENIKKNKHSAYREIFLKHFLVAN